MSPTPTLNVYLFEGPIVDYIINLRIQVSLFVLSPNIEDRDEVEAIGIIQSCIKYFV
jgi:hypothetical protein